MNDNEKPRYSVEIKSDTYPGKVWTLVRYDDYYISISNQAGRQEDIFV